MPRQFGDSDMSTMRLSMIRGGDRRLDLMAGVVLVLVCLLTYLALASGFMAIWQFDDRINLERLASVTDVRSAMAFVFDGRATAFGRPLSMASFLVNVGDWPNSPAAFRRVSVGLHLINGLLLCWIALEVGRRFAWPRGRALLFAVTLSGLWMLNPIQVSGIMMPVQRMTMLSGLFVLLGVLLYLQGRRRVEQGQLRAGMVWMTLALVIGGGLGVLAKENAVLLPLLLLVLELVLPKVQLDGSRGRWLLAWRAVFLVAPLLLLAGYFIVTWDGVLAGYRSRPFALGERLASELVILWDYVRQILLPNVRAFGPYHDDATIYQLTDPAVIAAALAWLAVFAVALRLRRVFPVLLFGLAWFWAGHLIESTFISLELYFEHRNYLPSIGLLAVLAVLLVWIPLPRARWLATLAAVLVSLGLTARVASLWSENVTAAEVWYQAHPGSARAAQTLSYFYREMGFLPAARNILDEASQHSQIGRELKVQALLLSCRLGDPPQAMRERFDAILAGFTAAQLHGSSFVRAIHDLGDAVDAGQCSGLVHDDVSRLAQAALENPYIYNKPNACQHLYFELAKQAERAGDLASKVKYVDLAFQSSPTLSMARLRAVAYFQNQQLDAAVQSIDQALGFAPPFGPGHLAWTSELLSLKQAFLAIHGQLSGGSLPD